VRGAHLLEALFAVAVMPIFFLSIVEGPAARPVLNDKMPVIILAHLVVLLAPTIIRPGAPLSSALSTARRQDIEKVSSQHKSARQARLDSALAPALARVSGARGSITSGSISMLGASCRWAQ
jgi:hypothetical protein